MITVHHLEHSRSHRVLWLLEELGVPYEMVVYERDKKTMLAPPELKKIHPLGKAPIVTDGELVLVESAVILEYLVDKYGNGRLAPAAGSPERLRYTYWMHYAEGSAMAPLLLKLVFEQIKRKAPWPVKPIAKGIAGKVLHDFVDPQIQTHFDWVESQLAKSKWLVGDDLTAADIQMSYPIEAHSVRANPTDRPNLARFLEQARARPAYAKALEKGGPTMLSAD